MKFLDAVYHGPVTTVTSLCYKLEFGQNMFLGIMWGEGMEDIIPLAFCPGLRSV